jgi:hypothetical protein
LLHALPPGDGSGGLARIVYGQDMGVLEPSGCLDLALEALGTERPGMSGMAHLESDGPLVPEVMGEVHGGHAATPELALECAAVTQGVGQG